MTGVGGTAVQNPTVNNRPPLTHMINVSLKMSKNDVIPSCPNVFYEALNLKCVFKVHIQREDHFNNNH